MTLEIEGSAPTTPASERTVLARRVPKPRFSGHRGATWDSVTVHIDGEPVRIHADTTWGSRGYFTLDSGETWYAMPTLRHDPFCGPIRYLTVPAKSRLSGEAREQRRRKVRVQGTRIAGRGANGQLYGVTTTRPEGPTVYRRKPCETCPWRRDSDIGRFPAGAYRETAHTAYDMDRSTFACHEAGAEAATICAGFLLVNSVHNFGARAGCARGEIDRAAVGNPDGVPLYGSYREMAVANGVDPADPVLAPCRANDE